jgi:branched-subunit amino acid aminotransferase/4-amino-4-deoxychorismate lyase
MSNAWAYFNGEWMPGANLRIAVDDLGFLLGATVTERLRTFRGQVFRLDEHLQRMERSLLIVGLDTDRIIRQIGGAVAEFVDRNGGLIADDDDWSIAAFATPGVVGTSQPTVCVHGYPLQFQQWSNLYVTGLPVIVSNVRQVPRVCLPPELKCRSRMHFYLADRAAAAMQPGARAILLDQEGYVAEATTANVLAYRAGEGLVSPPNEHILWGVSLSTVQELAAQLSIPFVMRRLAVEELATADEAFLASTSVCLLPIVECDGRHIGEGTPGPVFRRLLTAWSGLVGVDILMQARRCATRRQLPETGDPSG